MSFLSILQDVSSARKNRNVIFVNKDNFFIFGQKPTIYYRQKNAIKYTKFHKIFWNFIKLILLPVRIIFSAMVELFFFDEILRFAVQIRAGR